MADQQNKKPLRRAGLISPFGVGATVDYADGQSLMTSAIDHWPSSRETCPAKWKIDEERLCDALKIKEIRFPPDFESGRNIIPAARFPRWQHCPRCHSLRRKIAARDCNNPECKKKNIKALPMRFVAICSNGHIDDIDWMRWVHGDAGGSDACQLRYSAGRSASLSGIAISCSCGKRRTLGGLFSPADNAQGLQQPCRGHRPWLGTKADQPCDEMMQAAQKGASNVYFPKVESAIFVPDWIEEEANKVHILVENDDYWSAVEDTADADGVPNRKVIERYAIRRGIDFSALYSATLSKLSGEELEEKVVDLKPAEYAAITSCAGSSKDELFVRGANLENYEGWMNEYFSGVYLVPKLRETRVLSGFTRLQPPGPLDEARIQPVSSEKVNWLPGIKVTGEGFLLTFDIERLRSFSLGDSPRKRASRIKTNVNRVNEQLGRDAIELDPAELVIHTFGHLMIRAISYVCGYGSSALRERIYVDLGAAKPMAGVLIYTASGDSEGSLGGIVRQAEPGRLEKSILYALNAANWCSSDPVCAETEGQGSSGANLAACHACALLPETSCEYGNRLLDRVTVVGSEEDRKIGFFGNLLKSNLI